MCELNMMANTTLCGECFLRQARKIKGTKKSNTKETKKTASISSNNSSQTETNQKVGRGASKVVCRGTIDNDTSNKTPFAFDAKPILYWVVKKSQH